MRDLGSVASRVGKQKSSIVERWHSEGDSASEGPGERETRNIEGTDVLAPIRFTM